jgi:chemotaxis protein MotB
MSEEESNSQPVIVIKKKNGHGGHHGGAWKVAYADFVTAMMAFFLVMWLVNQSDIVKDAVQGYFQDPTGYMENFKSGGTNIMEGGSSPVKRFKYDVNDIKSRLQRQKNLLTNVGNNVRMVIEKLPQIGDMKNFIEIEVTPEGLQIQLIDASATADSAIFFDIGSARLKPMASLILAAIAAELAGLPYHIVIEGHTDSQPYRGRKDYSNWELSTDRANSARRLMEVSGLNKNQIVTVRGYADNKLKVKDDPTDPRNRRVTIIVLNEEYERHLDDLTFSS